MLGPLGEVAPAAPAIASLGALVVLVTALGLLLVAHVFIGALFRVAGGIISVAVGWVPWLGHRARGGLLAIEHRVNHALSGAIEGVEQAIAQTWHVFAATIQWFGHVTAQTAKVAASLWWYVNVKYPLHVLYAAAHAIRRVVTVVERRTVVIEHKTAHVADVLTHPRSGPLAAGVKWGTKTLAADLERFGAWTRARVRWIAHAVAITIPGEIGRLGGEVEALGRAARRALRWAKRHERLLAASGFAALLIHALAKLGAGWLRCDNVRNVGRRVCGMDKNALENLLGLTVGIVGTISILEMARELQEITDAETRAIRFLIRETR